MFFRCDKAAEVWRQLGLQELFWKALGVDLAWSTLDHPRLGGNFIAPSCEYNNKHEIDVSTMETMGLLAGLQLTEAIGARSIMVELDSMEVVVARY
jgi:hypothetical protein